MLVELLNKPEIIAAIAIVLATLLGALIKRSIDSNKLIPLISFILSLIMKAEVTHGAGSGEQKFIEVVNEVELRLTEPDLRALEKKHGTIKNAVQWVFDKVGQPLILKGLARVFKI